MTSTFPIRLGSAGHYELSREAFDHILSGDTAVRPSRSPNRTDEVVLAGGLHTYGGWSTFIARHPSVVHLLQFRMGRDDDWYFAREFQNGVIALRIPRRLFTGTAAKITRRPDLYYKSGYLWKTLYPRTYTEEDILSAIHEALDKMDQEDSTFPTPESPDGVLYGYAAVNDPMTAIKLRVQVRGNQILSAFPSWEQPSTGNNGKPYSHEHSISFQIAESTLDYTRFLETYGRARRDNQFHLAALIAMTPDFILTRPRRDVAVDVDTWRNARQQDLERIADAVSEAEVANIEAYLADYVCAKDPYSVQRSVYGHYLDEIDRSLPAFNAAQLTHNIAECLWVLSMSDRRFGLRRAIEAIVRFLSMALVHTGGLNTLLFKRLLTAMVAIAQAHHDVAAVRDVFAALAVSPCRAALYSEFDLNPFLKTNDERGLLIIGLPELKLELRPEHLFEFLALNFGENYLRGFSKEQRLALARKTFESPQMFRFAEDALSHLRGSDFAFFMVGELDSNVLIGKQLPREQDLLAIAHEYGRMLTLLRQRVVLDDPQAYLEEPDYEQYGTQAFFELIRQKHKHQLVMIMHTTLLNQLLGFARHVGYDRLEDECEFASRRLSIERIPLPKAIPDYIDSWQKNAATQPLVTDEMVERVLGRQA